VEPRHREGSGCLKSALDSSLASGDLEQAPGSGSPGPTCTLRALWVRERMNGG